MTAFRAVLCVVLAWLGLALARSGPMAGAGIYAVLAALGVYLVWRQSDHDDDA